MLHRESKVNYFIIDTEDFLKSLNVKKQKKRQKFCRLFPDFREFYEKEDEFRKNTI
jgi:hypothetical protein